MRVSKRRANAVCIARSGAMLEIRDQSGDEHFLGAAARDQSTIYIFAAER